MPGSIIKEPYCVLLPARRLLIQLCRNVVEERHHNVAVGVGMRQRVKDLPICVKCCNQGYPWIDYLGRNSTGGLLGTPLLADEVELAEPRLVHIDDALARFQLLQQHHSKPLSQNEASLGVALNWHLAG